MYFKRNIAARSRNEFCHVKAIRITYSECVAVALVTNNAKLMLCNVICGLSGSTIFFHTIS
jgi:hypothetical protein